MLHICTRRHQEFEPGMSRAHLGLMLVSLVTPGMMFILSVTHVSHWQDGEIHKVVYKERGTQGCSWSTLHGYGTEEVLRNGRFCWTPSSSDHPHPHHHHHHHHRIASSSSHGGIILMPVETQAARGYFPGDECISTIHSSLEEAVCC